MYQLNIDPTTRCGKFCQKHLLETACDFQVSLHSSKWTGSQLNDAKEVNYFELFHYPSYHLFKNKSAAMPVSYTSTKQLILLTLASEYFL